MLEAFGEEGEDRPLISGRRVRRLRRGCGRTDESSEKVRIAPATQERHKRLTPPCLEHYTPLSGNDGISRLRDTIAARSRMARRTAIRFVGTQSGGRSRQSLTSPGPITFQEEGLVTGRRGSAVVAAGARRCDQWRRESSDNRWRQVSTCYGGLERGVVRARLDVCSQGAQNCRENKEMRG